MASLNTNRFNLSLDKTFSRISAKNIMLFPKFDSCLVSCRVWESEQHPESVCDVGTEDCA